MTILFLNCYLELKLLHHPCLLFAGNACKHASIVCWQGKEAKMEGMKGEKREGKGRKKEKREKKKFEKEKGQKMKFNKYEKN